MKHYKPSFLFILKSRLKGRSFLYEFYFKGKKTLDIGCGEGEFMKHDKNLIWGFDPNKRVVDRLKSEGYKAESANGAKMSYADNEFEMAHCHNVIEHLDVSTAYNMLVEARRVLKSGGSLVLSSEVVTKKFWETFGHIKPYPPAAIVKLLRPDSREEFEGLAGFEPVGLFYIGDLRKNKLAYLVTFTLGYFTSLFRREYFLVLRKK
jgi:SAM-dependent methyltransferase